MTHEVPFFVVDAFTEENFRGNPAGVVVVDAPVDTELALRVAREVNHAETAFVRALGPGRYELRWFKPTMEVDLCGHATLATTAALVEEMGEQSSAIVFETKSGKLTVLRDAAARAYVLDFPTNAPKACATPPGLAEAFGLKRVLHAAVAPKRYVVLELDRDVDLPTIRPNFGALERLTLPDGAAGVVLTRLGPEPYDFTSRMFSPWTGNQEDPVTGAAHTVLAPYWGERLGRREFHAYQASARGGELHVRWKGERVDLIGRAAVTIRGKLSLR